MMLGKYPRTTNVNFFRADLSILKLDEYLQLLVTNTYLNYEHLPQPANKTALCGTY
jgi:hypothetical protein